MKADEVERLRGLLTRCDEYLAEKGVIRDAKLRREIRSALSQQAEPVPAQDEREAFEAHLVAHHGHQPHTLRSLREGDSYQGVSLPLAWSVWQARPAQTEQQPELTVWEGAMPESNGKSNFTAVLMRKGADLFDDISGGMTIARSEYPDRVRYEADCVRWLIGELTKEPCITDYNADKHSGYAAPIAQTAPQPEQSGLSLNKTRDQWKKVDAKFCAVNNSQTANFHLIRDAQRDIETLHAALSAQGDKP